VFANSAATEWAIANGVSDGTYLNASATREQIATMLFRLATPGKDGWGGEALAWAASLGIMNDGRGGDPATRAEVATMIMRFADKVKLTE
jgi:hypothetical protein